MHIVFLDRASIQADIRPPAIPHRWSDYPATAPAEVVARLQDADIVVTNKVPLRADALQALPQLRMIAVCATGVDNIDVDYCRRHGIAVANIRDYALHAVPEHVFMLILALRRNLLAYREDLRRGLWQRAAQFCLFTHPIHDLHGSTLGVIGHGALGRAVARLAEAFGMRVLVAERKGEATPRAGRVAFETLLENSDVISLHLPLTAATRALIGTAELARMRRHALLINCARGGVVDEQALAEALRHGTIAGAASDVLTREPPTAGNVLLDLDVPNFILTPHVAWASREAMQALADQLIDNIEAFAQGRARNRVV